MDISRRNSVKYRKFLLKCSPFLDLDLPMTDGIVSSKIYDKRDDFNVEKVNFPFLDGDLPRYPSSRGVIAWLLKQGLTYRCNYRNAFSITY